MCTKHCVRFRKRGKRARGYSFDSGGWIVVPSLEERAEFGSRTQILYNVLIRTRAKYDILVYNRYRLYGYAGFPSTAFLSRPSRLTFSATRYFDSPANTNHVVDGWR